MTVLLPKEKASILLVEYSALRAQMLQRNTSLNQAFTVSGTIVLASVTLAFTQSVYAGILLLVLVPPVIFLWLG